MYSVKSNKRLTECEGNLMSSKFNILLLEFHTIGNCKICLWILLNHYLTRKLLESVSILLTQPYFY